MDRGCWMAFGATPQQVPKKLTLMFQMTVNKTLMVVPAGKSVGSSSSSNPRCQMVSDPPVPP